jgi:ribonuclease P protein component
VGIVVPKHKRTAVERNRLKRRLRELVRTRLLGTLPAMDLVIRTLPEAYDAPFDALGRQLERVGERVRRLPGEAPPPLRGAAPRHAPPAES